MNSRLFRSLSLAAVLGIPAAPARAQETVAVLSSKSGAYLEAFSAFTAAYGAEVPSYDLSAEKPRFGADTRLVVAFGGNASSFQYPERLDIVYCLAPGYLRKSQPGRRVVKISMLPPFDALIAKIKLIQPDIRSLAVFWLSTRYSAIERDIRIDGESGGLEAAGTRNGLEVRPFGLQNLDALPSLLRTEISRVNAFWLPPDPLLMNQDTLQAIKNFSWDNRIVFYGASRTHTREGAVASLGPNFAAMGRAAAAAALKLLGGGAPPAEVYLDSAELSLNLEAARKCGITLPPAAIKEAVRTFP